MNKIKKILVMTVFSSVCVLARANLYTYDLDSLVYMSPQIVEGTLGGSRHAYNNTIWPISISKVHKGNLIAGQSINVTAMDFYRVAKNMFGAGEDLKEGDKLFFFGERAKSTMLYSIPTNAEIYWSAPSGIRYLVGEKAVEFYQYDNPGPYVAAIEGVATNAAIPTVGKLREQIQESIVRVEKWRPVLERGAKSEDIPLLLEILRTKKSFGNLDFYGYVKPGSITELTCKQLVSLKDVSALTNAIGIDEKLSGKLGGGFDSASGRQFLWSNITDKSQAIAIRIKWASFLSDAGMGEKEEHHLKRIAELAAIPGQDDKLQVILLDSLRDIKRLWPFTHLGNRWDAPAQAGVDETASILKSYLERTDSEEVKFKIDLALSAFNGEKEGIVSILRFSSYDNASRELHYSYEIFVYKGTGLTADFAFQSVQSGQKWNVAANWDLKLNDGMQGNGANQINLPKDLPRGRYRVFLEYLQNGKAVAASHYFETDL